LAYLFAEETSRMDEAAGGRKPYATLRWALIPVVAAHNFEEWLTFPIYGETMQVLATRAGIKFDAPPWERLQFALIVVTILPALVTVWASTGRQHWLKDFAVCSVASILLANVFIPHVPAAIAAGGYAPGLVTAVAINLPFVLLLLRAAVREQILPKRLVWRAVAVGAITLPLGVVGALTMSNVLLQLF
jgi:hypothetical protein